jgi:4,5:9,10-diseco-3-hydroxy-5,9,17-trioxoandrosta-1(10),2-diene-4-oate hydrolase
MVARTIAARAASQIDRYLDAERALWTRYGLAPIQRFVEMDDPTARLRLLDVGFGEPVLFVHGLLGPGAFAPLVRELRDFRCLILDRPGWGLSTRIDYANLPLGSFVAAVLDRVLAGLRLDRVHVVGASGGTLWALRLAETYPERVGRVALIGAGPLLDEVPAPSWLRLMASPLGTLMLRNTSRETLRSVLEESGHRESLDDGRIPEELLAWRLSASRDTDAMRSERDMLRHALISWTTGRWRAGALFSRAALRAIRQRTLYLHAAADPVGATGTARRVTELLPQGELHIVEGHSHEPWLEDPRGIANRLTTFLRAQD